MRKTETEKAMRKEERYKGVLNWFKENVPVAETELHYDDPYQLLIAVILSAQCTDKRVNMITPALFEAFPTPEVMAHQKSSLNTYEAYLTRTIRLNIW